MGDTWVTDMGHFLEDRRLGQDMPTAALNLALHLGAIVAWMTSREAAGVQRTNVRCRRSPGRRRCASEIEAEFESPGAAILWRCPTCGDNGRIDGWQGTPWDRSKVGAADRAQLEGLVAARREARQRIDEGDQVPVRLTARDNKLLSDLVIDLDYLERLRPIPGSTDLIGEYTLDDLEDMLGYVAAEANHTENTRLRTQLDELYDRLSRVQRSYDDGNWNDSDV